MIGPMRLRSQLATTALAAALGGPPGATGFWLNIPETSAECPACGTPQTGVAVAFLHAVG